MPDRRAAVGIVALLCLSPQPGVALSEWGVGAYAFTADCPSFCTNFQPPSPGQTLQNQITTTAFHPDERGLGESTVTLAATGLLAVPEVKARAESAGGIGGGQAESFGVEGYTYTGVAPGSFTLNVSFSGIVVDPTPADPQTHLRAQVYVFDEAGFDFVAAGGDPETAILEGAVELDSTDLPIAPDGTTNVQTVTDSISFSIAPGSSVYVLANVRAEAERDGSYADGYHTLTMSFADATGLTSASALPEPGRSCALACGVAALIVLRATKSRR